MYQKLGTPIEQIQFAWIQFRRELIFPNRFDRIADSPTSAWTMTIRIGRAMIERIAITSVTG